jgi:hypothetical protein
LLLYTSSRILWGEKFIFKDGRTGLYQQIFVIAEALTNGRDENPEGRNNGRVNLVFPQTEFLLLYLATAT